MAIDYESWAKDLLKSSAWMSLRVGSNEEITYMASVVRKFAAEVIRDAAADNGKGWNLPEVTKLFNEWLERRAAEIEAGR